MPAKVDAEDRRRLLVLAAAELIADAGINALTHTQIANAIKDPTSPVGTAMAANVLVGQANYLSAAICSVDGNKPASVCSSKGVTTAAAVLKSAKKVG